MIERKRIYIAGRVSGIDYDEALSAFADAAKAVEQRGDYPVNPTLYCDKEWDWQTCMRTVIPLLVTCDGVYMMKGWRQSKGAKLEHFIALKLGLTIELEK